MKNQILRLAVVDDHRLFRSGLIKLIHSLGEEFQVIYEANNGKEFLNLLNDNALPDLAIIDISMPVMDGYATVSALKERCPELTTLVLTMDEDESALIKMLRLGVNGYLNKDIEPLELKKALITISEKGFYYTEFVTGKLIEALHEPKQLKNNEIVLKEKEKKFLELACSDYTYKEIADKMCASIKTVDGYRNALFEKFEVRSRVGLVLFALRNNLVSL